MIGLLFQQDLEERLQAFYADSVNDRRLGNCIFASGSLCKFSLLIKRKGALHRAKTNPLFLCNDDNSYYVFYIKMSFFVLFTPVCNDSGDNKKDGKLEKNVYIVLFCFLFFNQLELLRHNFEGAALVKMYSIIIFILARTCKLIPPI